jgi:hypothetical protein
MPPSPLKGAEGEPLRFLPADPVHSQVSSGVSFEKKNLDIYAQMMHIDAYENYPEHR